VEEVRDVANEEERAAAEEDHMFRRLLHCACTTHPILPQSKSATIKEIPYLEDHRLSHLLQWSAKENGGVCGIWLLLNVATFVEGVLPEERVSFGDDFWISGGALLVWIVC
jgi:hypothetical protein